MNKYEKKFKVMLTNILKEQKENQKNLLEDKEIKKEFKNTIKSMFYSEVENTEEFKGFFPNYEKDKKSSLPKDIMGPKGDGRKVTTMEKEIRKNENNIGDIVGSQKSADTIGPVIPFGQFMKDVNKKSSKSQEKISELKPASESRIENYGV